MSQKTDKSRTTLFSFYKKIEINTSNSETTSPSIIDNTPPIEQPTSKKPRTGECRPIQHDPGSRCPIWEYPQIEQDEIRRTYIRMGPCQPKLREYEKLDGRRFCFEWFKKYDWLEYSVETKKAYCFPCFLFETNPPKHTAFTSQGFNSWKRVGGKSCALLQHAGTTSSNSVHPFNVTLLEGLKNTPQHIDKMLNKISDEEILKNRLRVITTVKSILLLACQACAFRGDDESANSTNRGNFIEVVKFAANLNEKVAEVVLDNAPAKASYISPDIQKEILEIISDHIRKKICDEIGDSKFCILVDEAQDESNREQMAIVLRFVDKCGFVRERFFDVVGVEDTTALTLKTNCLMILSRNGLLVENMRGQGYDGASNMRGAWNGLQALFLKDCPYAYYIHCFAHRLQLALVAASSDVSDVCLFFQMLSCIINLVDASPKRSSQLKAAQKAQIEKLIATGELQTGKGANQKSTLRRPGATRWSSHYDSVSSLIDLYQPTREVLNIIFKEALNNKMKAQAKGTLREMNTFQFVFILHMIYKVMGITDVLCRALQKKSQDIVNAMHLISATKSLLRELRENKWESFLEDVESFCKKNLIVIPDMNAHYWEGTGRSCQQNDDITIGHYYRFDIFNATIDFQLVELDSRFNERAIELLTLSTALDPRESYKSFKVDDICTLAEKYYPEDFNHYEIQHLLKSQLQHYEWVIRHNSNFQDISTMSELCQKLISTGKSESFFLVERLIRLVLTLPVSMATTERAFSALKIIKTPLRNKMDDKMLGDCMMIYIEKEIAKGIDPEAIVDDFDSRKSRKVKLR